MMIPGTYFVALLLTVISMLCWGSWANTMKLAGKWRFELYYFDYTFGVVVCSLIAAFTFGSIDSAPADMPGMSLSFADNMSISSRSAMAWAAAGGIIFNLANLLLVAAISVAGLSVAFPVGIGVALIVGVILNYIIKPAGNPTLLFGGVAVVLMAIVVTALAHAAHAKARAVSVEAEPQAVAGARAVQRPSGQRGGSSPLKGIILSLVAGLLMGAFYPLVEMSKKGDLGLGPYAAAFCFSMGILFSTPLFNLFFMNVPVEGDPLSIVEYFKGTSKQHLLGLAGGIIWCVGTIANFVASSAPPSVNVGPAVSYAIGQGATLISTLWGLVVWKEFAGATPAVSGRLLLMLILFIAGLAMLSMAPLYK
jgi:glucose uptake protein